MFEGEGRTKRERGGGAKICRHAALFLSPPASAIEGATLPTFLNLLRRRVVV